MKNLKESPKGFYFEKEIAKQLRITLPTLKSMRDKGQIDFFRIGKSIRYPAHVFQGKLKLEA